MAWYEYVLIFIIVGFVILVITSNIIKKKKNPKSCAGSKDCIGDCSSCVKSSELIKQYRQNHPYMYTLHVEGMKCGECEAHINDEIRRHFKVNKVISSRKENKTTVISSTALDVNALKQTISNLGYTVR